MQKYNEPWAAFKRTGYCILPDDAFCHLCKSSTVFRIPDPCATCTPAFSAKFLLEVLSPKIRNASTGGPMNWILLSAHFCAKSAFSERKPYPGWIPVAPVFLATLMIASMSR